MAIYFNKPHQNDGYLNNSYPSQITVDNYTFVSSEHYITWKYVMLFEPALESLILAATDSKEMKVISNKVKTLDNILWDSIRYDIMKEALYYKFLQNPRLLNNLIWTGNSGIVYGDPKDKIWGIGITIVEALMDKPWRGQNLLGKALIETRTRFKPKV